MMETYQRLGLEYTSGKLAGQEIGTLAGVIATKNFLSVIDTIRQ